MCAKSSNIAISSQRESGVTFLLSLSAFCFKKEPLIAGWEAQLFYSLWLGLSDEKAEAHVTGLVEIVQQVLCSRLDTELSQNSPCKYTLKHWRSLVLRAMPTPLAHVTVYPS